MAPTMIADDREQEAAALAQDAVEHRHGDEHHERRRDEQRELVPVDREDALEDIAHVQLLFHARARYSEARRYLVWRASGQAG